MSQEETKPLISNLSGPESEVPQGRADSPVYAVLSLLIGLLSLPLCVIPVGLLISIIGVLVGVLANQKKGYNKICRVALAINGTTLVIGLVIFFATISMMAGRMYTKP